MRRKKHKRSSNMVLMYTRNAPNAELKQLQIKPWIIYCGMVIVSILIGFVVGYFIYEDKIWETAISMNQDKQQRIEELEAENQDLQSQIISAASEYEMKISNLEDEIKLLSNSLNTTIKSEEELALQLEKQQTPTEFPLSGLASMEETQDEGNPICLFQGSEGTNVLATASGIVDGVVEDEVYGNRVSIDHGNGYKTIYRNKGTSLVRLGDSVIQGAQLFSITKDNTVLGYQVMYEGEYINPIDILAING